MTRTVGKYNLRWAGSKRLGPNLVVWVASPTKSSKSPNHPQASIIWAHNPLVVVGSLVAASPVTPSMVLRSWIRGSIRHFRKVLVGGSCSEKYRVERLRRYSLSAWHFCLPKCLPNLVANRPNLHVCAEVNGLKLKDERRGRLPPQQKVAVST